MNDKLLLAVGHQCKLCVRRQVSDDDTSDITYMSHKSYIPSTKSAVLGIVKFLLYMMPIIHIHVYAMAGFYACHMLTLRSVYMHLP